METLIFAVWQAGAVRITLFESFIVEVLRVTILILEISPAGMIAPLMVSPVFIIFSWSVVLLKCKCQLEVAIGSHP